jgi:photosystem II stability/assembly factor-like uncharacterized protein
LIQKGTTWSFGNHLPDSSIEVQADNGLTSTGMTALAIDSQDPSIVYAGTTSGGVFKSTDAGASWNGIGLGRITSLAIDPNHSGVLYAGVSDCGIFRSTDGGAGWSAVNNGATENFIQALSVDPDNLLPCREIK